MVKKRSAQTKTEIDLLPPFGEPEVVTTGDRALDVAIAGITVAGALSYVYHN